MSHFLLPSTNTWTPSIGRPPGPETVTVSAPVRPLMKKNSAAAASTASAPAATYILLTPADLGKSTALFDAVRAVLIAGAVGCIGRSFRGIVFIGGGGCDPSLPE